MHRIERPGHDVEILSRQGRIDVLVHAHKVGGDPLVLAVFAQLIGLEANIVGSLLCKPALEIQQGMWIGLLRQFRLIGNVDLVKVLVHLRPKSVAPIPVQVFDVGIFLLQPEAKFAATKVAIAVLLAVMGKLVVDLPAPNGRIAAKALAKLGDDFGHILAVEGNAPASMRARAVIRTSAVRIYHQHLWMSAHQPDRRSC